MVMVFVGVRTLASLKGVRLFRINLYMLFHVLLLNCVEHACFQLTFLAVMMSFLYFLIVVL